MFFEKFLPLQTQRKKLLRQVQQGALSDFLGVPFPAPSLDYREAGFLSLDLETTGLDINHDHILSIGMVTINASGIDLASARHILVYSANPLPGETVTIHRLTDDIVSQGLPIRQALAQVWEQLAGKVLVAHHARIECGFLRRACSNLYGSGWVAPVIDTQQLAARRLARREGHIAHRQLRLDSLRQHYRLPTYRAHNALADAIATAELFLAEMAEISGGNEGVPLKKLLSRC